MFTHMGLRQEEGLHAVASYKGQDFPICCIGVWRQFRPSLDPAASSSFFLRGNPPKCVCAGESCLKCNI